MYLSIEDVKKQLNIDEDFIDDDMYIFDLIEAAETVVERHIDNKLETLIDGGSGTGLPAPLLQAIKLLVGNWYNNREAVTYAASSEVPLSYCYILDLYKNYGTEYNV